MRHSEKEEGTGLIVHPETFDIMTRSFAKGKGLEIKLSPEELMANKHLFGRKKKTNTPKMEGTGIVEDLSEQYMHHPEVLNSRAMIPNIAGSKNPLAPTTIPSMMEYADRLQRYNKDFGTNLGYLSTSGIHNALANLDNDRVAHTIMNARMRGTGSKSKSLISHNGTMLMRDEMELPPALRSQNYSSNFYFQTQMPPAYQKFSQGV